ncbi:MAG: DNA polymerase IV [Myxococcales bacterium 68-20]|nr:MAG: DNA polymerase IV [Myxococcales bacterium 68-20]
MRQILHVDMDAFFASVEQRDDPSLRGKPLVVGGAARRGVVAAASYEAREFGVRSAMPMAEALRRCRHLVVVPPRGDRYIEVSRKVFDVFHEYTPLVEGLSLDEAFLDVTASRSLFGDGEAIARLIKKGIYDATELTASAGVAPCKFAAKIASDFDKPNGLTVVPSDVAAFLAPLPIERMWGIGPKTAPTLRRLGYQTLGDLAKADPAALERALGSWGPEVRELARGNDPREVVPDREAKSIGAEVTYDVDLTTREAVARTLLAHASRVAERLTMAGLVAGAVVVKLKLHDFTLLTRRMTLPSPASDTRTLHDACLALLDRFPLAGARVRLTGVSAQELGPAEAVQPTLFRDEKQDKRRDVENVLLRAKERFGNKPITFASLLEDKTPRAAPEGDLERLPTRRR